MVDVEKICEFANLRLLWECQNKCDKKTQKLFWVNLTPKIWLYTASLNNIYVS